MWNCVLVFRLVIVLGLLVGIRGLFMVCWFLVMCCGFSLSLWMVVVVLV